MTLVLPSSLLGCTASLPSSGIGITLLLDSYIAAASLYIVAKKFRFLQNRAAEDLSSNESVSPSLSLVNPFVSFGILSLPPPHRKVVNMRLTVATVLALAYATAVFASPMTRLQNRQNGDDDDDDDGPSNTGNSTGGGNAGDDDRDDAVLFSPANLTTVVPGSTFNFTYLCDDDDCSSVRVALIQYIEVRNVIFLFHAPFTSDAACMCRSPLACPLRLATAEEWLLLSSPFLLTSQQVNTVSPREKGSFLSRKAYARTGDSNWRTGE